MSGVLAIVEEAAGSLARSAGAVVSAATTLASELKTQVEAVVLGGNAVHGRAPSLGTFGVRKVTVVTHPALASYHPDGYLEALEPAVRGREYEAVLLAASDQGKDLAPRLAARLDVPLLQEATALFVDEGRVIVTRPVYAGKAVLSATSDVTPLLVTLRASAFKERGGGSPAQVEVVTPPLDADAWPTRIVSHRSTGEGLPDVSEASVIVSGGRGLGGPEHWGVLEELRRALGSEATLGASRAVVDAGWRPHSEQVGQTGKTVSPRLYFAVGISGAVQHLAGMRTAGTIVAINKDPDAPIFRVADYGIVGDAFEIVPRLAEEIRRLKEPGGSDSGRTP